MSSTAVPLTFSPALGEQTVLKVAPVASGRPALQSVLFKATFDDHESLVKAHADGIKVEVWSDIPVWGRSSGEWGAFQLGTIGQGTVPAGTPTFSLDDASQADEGDNEDSKSIYVHVQAPFHEYIRARFSFTYRLVYPSGQVQWLGKFGQNGELVIEQGLPGVDLREGWNISDDGTYRTHAFPGERVLGQLTDPKAWTCWSWTASGLPTFAGATQPSEGLAMVLSPRPYAREVNVLRPLVFVASHSTSLRITEQGKIVLHSSSPFARVSFSVLEHSRELLEGIASLSRGEVVAFDDVSAVISCRSPDAELPLNLVVLPMADNLNGLSVFPLRSSALPQAASTWDGLMVSSLDMRTVKYVSQPTAQEDTIALIGASGCELVVAPVHEVVTESHTLHVALLTPHQEVKGKVVERSIDEALPTPPPSPPPSSAPSRAIADSTPDPISRPPSQDAPPRQPSPPKRRTSVLRPRSPRSSALIPFRSPHLVRRYLHMILNIVFWFWSVFARVFAVRLIGETNTRRISGLIELALLRTASPRTPTTTDELRSTDQYDDGGPSENAARTNAPSQGYDKPRDPAIIIPAVQHVTTVSSQDLDPQPPSVVVVVSVQILASCPEPPVMVLRGCNHLKGLRAMVDKKPLASPSIEMLDDAMHLLRFPRLEGGGQLEVMLDV
ncbi:hypothetical protein BD414DRAFT_239104 [Trametes punicea]|nr:hypothetical protein BD414DRAFT_239104 [Trametes punicea]